jgi:hypothetical protein
MKKSLFVGSVFLAFALTAATGLRPSQAEDCQDVLDNNVYSCQVKADFGNEFSDCFRFFSPGTQSDKFDLFVEGLGQIQGCSCKASGSFGTPDFNASKEFECVTSGSGGWVLSIRYFPLQICRRGFANSAQPFCRWAILRFCPPYIS